MRRKLAAGNWKMNGTAASLAELAVLGAQLDDEGPDVVVCPPAPLLYRAVHAAEGTRIDIGAQDCHMQSKGAFTGDISAEMIADTGARYVIAGHSERRDAHEERNSDIRAKVSMAWACDLTAIICIGEELSDHQQNNTLDIIAGQLAGSLPDAATAHNTVIAYEPIWAIGTGKVPTLEQITQVHDFIREKLINRLGQDVGDAIPLLYGGSVKPDNAETIFRAENVDGALVGGASLKAADFAPIIAALARS
ncbi:triose-phosphate isomerase [uncultured Sulfitobacter sp.]|uniref:triose-phosphate isomerase n=1 Tax=uncultured Sulfitobacter sp. TaxID=191468 RepID=UPI0026023F09|nr:triose-phosphate isomerase [uncultured Sulfitobacter sp.]